ncbi:hypothetical protein H632_c3249p0 [Helicosporidium sp. ATCC 50920]|nr:hypothetical protein H632_c3249p0 [Helicosporidium sp. ATCC 50920]|eukprot:KDD72512.1 hypothetical protein H632_c3249p0 [Helicosporidium sp. ATCC 50920]
MDTAAGRIAMADEVSGARFAEQADSGMLKSERDDFVKGDQNASDVGDGAEDAKMTVDDTGSPIARTVQMLVSKLGSAGARFMESVAGVETEDPEEHLVYSSDCPDSIAPRPAGISTRSNPPTQGKAHASPPTSGEESGNDSGEDASSTEGGFEEGQIDKENEPIVMPDTGGQKVDPRQGGGNLGANQAVFPLSG